MFSIHFYYTGSTYGCSLFLPVFVCIYLHLDNKKDMPPQRTCLFLHYAVYYIVPILILFR